MVKKEVVFILIPILLLIILSSFVLSERVTYIPPATGINRAVQTGCNSLGYNGTCSVVSQPSTKTIPQPTKSNKVTYNFTLFRGKSYFQKTGGSSNSYILNDKGITCPDSGPCQPVLPVSLGNETCDYFVNLKVDIPASTDFDIDKVKITCEADDKKNKNGRNTCPNFEVTSCSNKRAMEGPVALLRPATRGSPINPTAGAVISELANKNNFNISIIVIGLLGLVALALINNLNKVNEKVIRRNANLKPFYHFTKTNHLRGK